MTDVSDDSTKEYTLTLQEARQLADAAASSLPDRIQIAALTRKSKLPFKVLSLREVLLHRISALATSAVDHFERNQDVPAVVLTRAVVETVAVTYALHERISRFLEAKNTSDLDGFLMRALLGRRNQPEKPSATNVLTLVDRVDKTFPGFRSMYDDLCEYTHPNWAGTLGSFGKIDKEALELKLGPNKRSAAGTTGVATLSGALAIFHHYYNDSAGLVRQLNDYFEQGGSH